MSHRLSGEVVPHVYTLHFALDFGTFRFTGTQTTELEVRDPTTEIRLHCEDLDVTRVELLRNGAAVGCSDACRDGELRIVTDIPLAPGTYELRCVFAGALGDDLSGFYRSRYVDAEGRDVYLATTQFEAPYARKAFPCFDEPHFKATFDISLDIPASMTGVSNMPAVSESVNGARKTITFARTPRMSTYLLYMGAGHFDYIETTRGARAIRVYGVNGQSPKGRFACEFAADTLEYFERYSGIEYPLPKLDLLAIPDFAAGAMENWGAITFREVLLYADDQTTSLPIRKRIAEVMAHELWHQWSGNLVTMEWWDDLWLNEAFATYIAFKAVDHFFPEWHIWDDFVEADTGRAFAMDMLASTHPIAVTVRTPNEVEEIFDHISYGKGASVLRMVEHFIGEDAFRNGVSAYLQAHAYGNAQASDLWDALERQSSQPVREMLSAWITKPGFPLLKASVDEARLHVSQQRFALATDSPPDGPWPVPLTWVDSRGTHTALFDGEQATYEAPHDVFKLNEGQSGFYRVLYSAELYARIAEAIRDQAFDQLGRWGLVSDLWACVLTGHARLADLLTLLDNYERESAVFVLRAIESICGELTRHLRLPERGQLLYERFQAPFAGAHAALGMQATPDEPVHDRELRPLALTYLIHAADVRAMARARDMADAYLGGESIDPDMRKACLLALTRDGDRGEFNRLRQAYESATAIEEKLAFLAAMGELADEELYREYLEYALTDAVRRQDLRTVFAVAATNPSAPSVFGDWAREHWRELHQLRESHFVYMGLLQTLIASTPDREALEDVKRFLDSHSEGFEKTRMNATEKAEMVLLFREREKSCRIER
ncbi:MAG: hypothetical protein GF331_25170 [Chitinivibrionales bacterium]|nr:hypothetical protein [Chitinivibrionales bacterium]